MILQPPRVRAGKPPAAGGTSPPSAAISGLWRRISPWRAVATNFGAAAMAAPVAIGVPRPKLGRWRGADRQRPAASLPAGELSLAAAHPPAVLSGGQLAGADAPERARWCTALRPGTASGGRGEPPRAGAVVLGGICPWPRPSAHKPPCRVARCRRCWHRIEAWCPACGNSLALVVADQETIPWATLRRRTLPSRPPSPFSLVVQVDWREQPLLRHTARELGWTDDPPPQEI
ncbi:MAG: hypothetical protein RLZZ117_830 [Cyanobacteriota bacterium]